MNISPDPTSDSPADAAQAPRRGRSVRPTVAVALVALVVVVVAATLALRLRPSVTSMPPPRNPALAASQKLSLALYGYSPSGAPDISSLDPANPNAGQDNTSIQLMHMIFDGLVTLDATNAVELWGADRVSVSPDGLKYTFHIRAGQFFSDGAPVNASDYAWSLDRVINPCTVSPDYVGEFAEFGLNLLKDASIFLGEQCGSDQVNPDGAIQTLVGDSILPNNSARTLTLVLNKPTAYFLNVLALPSASVVDRRAMNGLGSDDSLDHNLVAGPTGRGGSGMFYVAGWEHATGSLTLKSNPHWWGVSNGKRPNFTEIDVHFYDEFDQEYSSYQQAAVDYIDAVGSDYSPASGSLADLHMEPSLIINSISFNWRMPPFDNPDARQAFCLALNRAAIVKQMQPSATYFNYAPPIPTWHLVPPGMPGYDPQLTGIDGVTDATGDLAKAQAHWQAYLATLHGKPIPDIKLLFYQSPSGAQKTREELIAEWTAAFPQVVGHFVDDYGNTYLGEDTPPEDSLYRDFTFAEYPDPAQYLSLPYAVGSPANILGVSVPTADTLMASADSMSDPTKQAARMSLYNQAEQDLVQQVATCPLYQPQNAYLLRSYVVGLAQTSSGLFPDDDWITGYVAKH